MSPVDYKVHPAIGIARVGNSEDHYFAPEHIGGLPVNPDSRPFEPDDFRDKDLRVRRQAVRFEVYRYEGPDDPGTPVRIGEHGVARVEWTVHVANKKAAWYEFLVGAGEYGYSPEHRLRNADVTDPDERRRLFIDPGPRTLSGPGESAEFSRHDNPDDYPMTFPPEHLEPSGIDSLGSIRTDKRGGLIALGGYGRSGTHRLPPVIVDYANNDRWWDDTSDGPVTARVVMDDGTTVPVDTGGWLLTAPPRFAPELVNAVTLYDTMFDTAVRSMGLRPDIYANGLWNRSYRPNWEQRRAADPRAHRALPLGRGHPRSGARLRPGEAGRPRPGLPRTARAVPQRHPASRVAESRGRSRLRAAADADAVWRQLLPARAGRLDVCDAQPNAVLLPAAVGRRAFRRGPARAPAGRRRGRPRRTRPVRRGRVLTGHRGHLDLAPRGAVRAAAADPTRAATCGRHSAWGRALRTGSSPAT